MLLFWRGLMVCRTSTRLLRDLASRVEGFDTAECLLEDVVSGFDERSDVLDERFFVEFLFFLIAFGTGESLRRNMSFHHSQ